MIFNGHKFNKLFIIVIIAPFNRVELLLNISHSHDIRQCTNKKLYVRTPSAICTGLCPQKLLILYTPHIVYVRIGEALGQASNQHHMKPE